MKQENIKQIFYGIALFFDFAMFILGFLSLNGQLEVYLPVQNALMFIFASIFIGLYLIYNIIISDKKPKK